MNANKRMFINILATYGRSVVAVGLTLFSSRWVLNSLGQIDFGLFSVVGSIIIFVTFLNTVMASSVARYYAFSIGQGKPEEVTQWFNAALSMHLCLASVLTFIGWPIGEYVISHVLTVPEDRLWSCLWVFRCSLLSAFVSMVSIPCVAMFTAQQKITETAFWGIIHVVLAFALAYSLTRLSGDLLLVYAIGMVAIIVFVQLIILMRAFVIFKECRLTFKYWFDWSKLTQIFSFAGWTLFGGLGGTLRNQGSAILLNLYFGPSINSAFGIAKQVSAQSDQMAMAMLGAFSPEITAREGRGDRTGMLSLANRANKFGTVLVLLFAIPLMIEMDYVLKLWLRIPPPYTSVLCRLILTTFLIDRLTGGFMLAVKAHGKIAAYQTTVGGTLMMTLPLAWLFLKQGLSPASVGVAFVMTMAGCTFGRVFWVRRLFGISPFQWLQKAIFPNILIGAVSAAVSYVFVYAMEESFLRLTLVLIVSMSVAALASWYWALDISERNYITKGYRKVITRLFSKVFITSASERF